MKEWPCQCKCHQQAGDWQERFDAQFVNEPGRIYWDRIKSFIASEIAAVREEERNRWINQPANEHDNHIRAAMKAEILEKLRAMPYTKYKGDYYIGYNTALDEVASLLSQ